VLGNNPQKERGQKDLGVGTSTFLAVAIFIDQGAASIEALQGQRSGGAESALIDVEDADTAEGVELPRSRPFE
jgi:hypothetical protein